MAKKQFRYSELGLTLDLPETWSFKVPQSNGSGRTFLQVLDDQHYFDDKKELVKKQLRESVFEAIDQAETEKDIGNSLDPIFENLSKAHFYTQDVNEDLLVKKANRNTLAKKLQPWCSQLNQNVPLVKSRPGLRKFFSKFKDVPAVIVCAGPSLKQSIDRLGDLKNKALIMAVDTSFKPLMKREIEPHFVNAHDANEAGEKFFKGVKTSAIGCFVNYIHPKTIASYDGPLTFYYVFDPSLHAYKTMALACDHPDRKEGSFLGSKITGGSSVAHTAMYIAMEFGCNPITFVGLDLSYPDLSSSHFESANPKNLKGQKLIDVWSISGEKIKTNFSFYSYKTIFERMAPMIAFYQRKKLYTSTEDSKGRVTGIVHAGLEPLAFDKFIKTYAAKEREELKNIMEVYNG